MRFRYSVATLVLFIAAVPAHADKLILFAGGGMLAGLLVLVPALGGASQRPGPDGAPSGTDPVVRPGGPAPAARR